MRKFLEVSTATVLVIGLSITVTRADQQILDDLIVDGSACVGQDCVNGESFGFDTIRLKENNLRIKFQDTSNTASFPSNDWQITANDSTNGGKNKFSIDDIDGGKTPFTIIAGAPSNSIFIASGGRVGFGTNTPVAGLHRKEGNTPTLRLEQDGSSGFTPQTWDIASNEANFFIRDATNGSKLPFRIRPGAPSSAIDVASTGNVGIGTSSPAAKLHVSEGSLRVSKTGNTSADSALLELAVQTSATTAADPQKWFVRATTINGNFVVRDETAGTVPFKIVPGAVTDSFVINADGSISVKGAVVHPDYVFKPDYELMPLKDLEAFVRDRKHLPGIPSKDEVEETGTINLTGMQMMLLKKVEELTLYTLEQQKTIDKLNTRLAALEIRRISDR